MCQVKDKFKKIISVILVLVTLFLIFVLPVSAVSNTSGTVDFFDIHEPNKFILHDSSEKAHVYNVSSALVSAARPDTNGYFISTGSGFIEHSGVTVINKFSTFTLQIPYSYSLHTGDVISVNFDAIGKYCDALWIVLVFADGSEVGLQAERTKTVASSDLWVKLFTDAPESALQPGTYLCHKYVSSGFYESTSGSDLVGIKIQQIFNSSSYPSSTWLNIESTSVNITSATSDKLDTYAWYSVEGWLKKLYLSLTEFISDSLDFFKSLPKRIDSLKTNIVSSIDNLPGQINVFFNNLGNKVSAIPNSIKVFFTDLGDRIGGFFDKLVDSVKGDFRDSFLGKIITLIDKIKSVITGADAHAYSVIDLDSDGSSDSSEDTSSGDWDINQKYMQPFNYDYWKVGE